MKIKQIVFTEAYRAELLEREINDISDDEILIKTAFTTISPGTEKANFIGDINISAVSAPLDNIPHFPRYLGYSGSGTVVKIGKNVKNYKIGDRVINLKNKHSSYTITDEKNIIRIPEEISLKEASIAFISTFPAAAVRKVKPEMGESGIVMGLGMLGLFAVQFLKASGVVPIIAVDPVKERRDFALLIGADYALDPFEKDFCKKVKELTEGGVNVAIEVTGRGEGLDMVLDCMQRFGRVALLGCTRDSDFTIDYYRKVHFPGITLVGAHTNARPNQESYPNYWAYPEEIGAIFRLAKNNRIDIKKMLSEVHSPLECNEVFNRLAKEKNFPIGVQFDWSEVE